MEDQLELNLRLKHSGAEVQLLSLVTKTMNILGKEDTDMVMADMAMDMADMDMADMEMADMVMYMADMVMDMTDMVLKDMDTADIVMDIRAMAIGDMAIEDMVK